MNGRAKIVDAGTGPVHRSPYGDSLRWITGDEHTSGAYSLHERTTPAGTASVAHSHSRVIESFYVLEGEFTFELDGHMVTARSGTYVHVPAGVSHSWRVTGDGAARALVLFAPAVPLAFFEEIDVVMSTAVGGRPDPRRLLAINQKYGLD